MVLLVDMPFILIKKYILIMRQYRFRLDRNILKLVVGIMISRREIQLLLVENSFFRTTIIEILIHEILHLYYYAPIEYYFYDYCTISDKQKQKKINFKEYPISFQTVYLLYKYQKQLVEKLGTAPFGAVYPHIEAGYQLLLVEGKLGGIPKKSLREILKIIYTDEDNYFITVHHTHKYYPYRKVSKDFMKAIYKTKKEIDRIERKLIEKDSEKINNNMEYYIGLFEKLFCKKYHENRKEMRR